MRKTAYFLSAIPVFLQGGRIILEVLLKILPVMLARLRDFMKVWSERTKNKGGFLTWAAFVVFWTFMPLLLSLYVIFWLVIGGLYLSVGVLLINVDLIDKALPFDTIALPLCFGFWGLYSFLDWGKGDPPSRAAQWVAILMFVFGSVVFAYAAAEKPELVWIRPWCVGPIAGIPLGWLFTKIPKRGKYND
jgi:hypothetical protein